MPLEWKPFLDGRMAVGGQPDGHVCVFFDGGQPGREDSYSCRLRATEARVLALALLGQLRGLLPLDAGGIVADGELGRLCNLALSRREGESVLIGDDISISIVEIRKDRAVRLCVTAPKSVPVYRSEILARMQAESMAPVAPAVESSEVPHV